MFFLFSLGAEMIRAGSLPSHTRAKRDKPQIGSERGLAGQEGLEGTPEFSVSLLVRTGGPCRKEQTKLPAWQPFPQSSRILLEPLPRQRLQQVFTGNLQPCKHHYPELRGNQQRSRSLCPQTFSAIDPND